MHHTVLWDSYGTKLLSLRWNLRKNCDDRLSSVLVLFSQPNLETAYAWVTALLTSLLVCAMWSVWSLNTDTDTVVRGAMVEPKTRDRVGHCCVIIWVVLSSECLSIESWIIKLESASFRQSLRVTYDVYSSEWKGVFYPGDRPYGIRTQKMSTHCWHHHFFGVLARKTLTSCRYEGSDRKCEWWCPRLDAGCMCEPTEWMDQKLMSTPDQQKSCDKDSNAAIVYSSKIR